MGVMWKRARRGPGQAEREEENDSEAEGEGDNRAQKTWGRGCRQKRG